MAKEEWSRQQIRLPRIDTFFLNMAPNYTNDDPYNKQKHDFLSVKLQLDVHYIKLPVTFIHSARHISTFFQKTPNYGALKEMI